VPMRNAACIGNAFLLRAGDQSGVIANKQGKGEIMPDYRLAIVILVIGAVVIVSMAVYIFLHFAGISLLESAALIGAGIFTLLLVCGLMLVILRRKSGKSN